MSSTQFPDGHRQPTNATARLGAILDVLTVNGSNAPVADVLASVFDIKDVDPNRNFLLAYTAITKMLESSQREVEKYIEADLDQYSAAYPSLRQCFTPKNSAQPWNAYKTSLNPTHVAGIKFTALHLKTLVPELEASNEDFAEILAAIDEMDQVLESEELSLHSKDALRDCLEGIRRAVREYKIWGSEGIDQSLKVFTGTLVWDRNLHRELDRDRARGGRLWEKTETVCRRIALVCGMLQSVGQVAGEYLPTVERLFLPETIINVPANDSTFPISGRASEHCL